MGIGKKSQSKEELREGHAKNAEKHNNEPQAEMTKPLVKYSPQHKCFVAQPPQNKFSLSNCAFGDTPEEAEKNYLNSVFYKGVNLNLTREVKMEEETEIKANEYKCCVCYGVFKKGWSDEEAEQEYEDTFGEAVSKSDALACDDCFNKYFKYELN